MIVMTGGRCDDGEMKDRGATLDIEVSDEDVEAYRLMLLRDPCGFCGERGRYGRANAIDHIEPQVYGGADSWENYGNLCAMCNPSKGTWPLLIGLARPLRGDHLDRGFAWRPSSWFCKACSMCGLVKPPREFYRDTNSGRCRDCVKILYHERRAAKREGTLARSCRGCGASPGDLCYRKPRSGRPARTPCPERIADWRAVESIRKKVASSDANLS